MSVALSSGVTGLQAHQKMLDVAGNNLANVNTTAYKSTKVNFSELLSQTIAGASAPTSTIGGTNPQQMGNGVGLSSISRDNTQGNIVKTGNPLDVAIEGEGYFIANDSEKNVYTRAGTFGVDEDSTLVDLATGYRIQRTGTTGEAENFQIAGDTTIYIPYDKPIEPSATTSVTLSGNLSANQSLETAQTQVLTSNLAFTSGNVEASSTTAITDLDQYSSGTFASTSIAVTGYTHAGSDIDTTVSIAGTETLGQLATALQTAINTDIAAAGESTTVAVTVSNGQLVVTDSSSGYSKLDLSLAWSGGTGDATLTMPNYFEMTTVGGEEVKDVSITVYDGSGNPHIMTGALVRTDTSNAWDFVTTSMTGDVYALGMTNRRVANLTFDPDNGSYAGPASTSTNEQIVVTFGDGTAAAQTISLDFGTVGKYNGLTQVGGPSTAVATDQDGYESGSLSSVAVSNEGIVIGTFSNGVKRDIATLAMAVFKNPMGLESIGKGYYSPTANSGTAVETRAMTSGAGKIQGSSLEKSNADVATEFVNLIQAQNGYQANARTIRVANDILRELTNIIR